MSALVTAGVFQELILLCKPVDVFSFAIRYYADEKITIMPVETAHSIHTLPFIFVNNSEFRRLDVEEAAVHEESLLISFLSPLTLSTACTIFCSSNARPMPNMHNTKATGDTIDPAATLDIINAMQLGSLWFEIKAIQSVRATR